MAEGEDVIVDVARHATEYAQALWRRRTQRERADPPSLAELAPRLSLLVRAASGRTLPLRAAQAPAQPTVLARLFRRSEGPLWTSALPATDGASIWLPATLGSLSADAALAWYRVMALQQAMRVARSSVEFWPGPADALVADLYLLFEAVSADSDLVRVFPGVGAHLRTTRAASLTGRPPTSALPPPLRAVEAVFRRECSAVVAIAGSHVGTRATKPSDSLAAAMQLATALRNDFPGTSFGSHPLYKDFWVGELRRPERMAADAALPIAEERLDSAATRSARLPRRPKVRDEDDDPSGPGAWMVQTSQPQEKAEDPRGLQRPTDRDDVTSADELADALSELPEARLVSSRSRPREVLLSDDPPEASARRVPAARSRSSAPLSYPEWDYRLGAYHPEAATVHELPSEGGNPSWVEQTLGRHRSMLQQIRRQFELLRARRCRLRRQVDGDEIDLDAYLESQSDFRAGLPLAQRLYQSERRLHRDLAIVLLVDVSGSTDSWVVGHRRVIDVEREALLLVCVALEGLMQPYAVQAFSGDGPQRVIVRNVKGFDEAFSAAVARRIASLEPEQYTRVGAAVRHATTQIMRQPAQHRLLLLLSDGKPNDVDDYNGRYGVEDFRQAITEAKLQGVSPFCLTIDRQAAAYLPFVFGPGHYALLTRPERLPVVLLDWVRRLVAS
jgi:nitric oxide reductase NorD protein